MNDIIKVLTILNERIIPAKLKNNLRLPHSISLIDKNCIEFHLYPLAGGEYHFPIEVNNRNFLDIINEIESIYKQCLLIDASFRANRVKQ